MKGWTESDIKAYQDKRNTAMAALGRINSMKDTSTATTKASKLGKPFKMPRKTAKFLFHIMNVLQMLDIPFVTEHKFCPERRFRFDIALLEHKIAIEYEGLFNDEHSHSGHTSRSGFLSNCEKYNLATVMGWRLLRYTANKEQNKDFLSHIQTLINNKRV